MSLAPIEVRRHGSLGPPLVVLHGGPGAPGSAAGLARALSARFRVLEPLQRRGGEVPLTVARHVQDLADVAPPRAALVGWSWGAMLALSYAAAHPERADRLALVSCGTYDEASRAAFRTAFAARLGEDGRARMNALRARLADSTDPAVRDRIVTQLGETAGRAQSVDALPDDEAADLPADSAGHDETWRDVLALQARGEEPAAFAAIRAPVRMFHGAEDPHPGPSTRDVLRLHVPHLEYEEFADCGHSPWRERRAREPFLAALSAWLLATSD
jgi:pimeloyl-ACP methyl ester carboxylesterase